MAQQAYRVRQQSTLDSLRAERDQLRKENVELKEKLMNQDSARCLDLQGLSEGSGSEWQWLVEQSTTVSSLRPGPIDGVLSGYGAL